jgi:hypothetical protein
MKKIVCFIFVCFFLLLSSNSWAQNWSFTVYDSVAGTPLGQANGVTGGQAIVYATLLNYTGTPFSDDGTGIPAPSTSLDFMGLGWTLQPGQTNLESFFVPDPQIPGFPTLLGSSDGSLPGSVLSIPIGFFDLTGVPPGVYEEDFSAGAAPTDINSTIPFGDNHGTLRLNVTSAVSAPEPSTVMLLFVTLAFTTIKLRKRSPYPKLISREEYYNLRTEM